ncbi:MAG: tRNA pseudouridine synthase A [Chlamydiia bacterium]|nr:tRNA pseudouridine synthase A [Chlamydiia bacterium]
MKTFKAHLSYLGTPFFGFVKVEDGPTVQEALEKAFTKVFGTYPKIQAASRTDRGVHALDQVIQFPLDHPIPPEDLRLALNTYLPHTIRIQSIAEVPSTFHPSLDPIGKEYRYQIDNHKEPNPFRLDQYWHFPYPIHLPLITQAIPHLIGTHDFASFTNKSASPHQTTIRTLHSIEVTSLAPNLLQISLYGDHFLYKMVRNLIGALAYIGSGKMDPDSLPQVLQAKSRPQAAITAPAHGLFLSRIDYLNL